MKRGLIFVYGVLSYAFFFAAFAYAIGFIGNIGVPKPMDSAPTHPLIASLLIDLGLLTLFAVQHSGMARPAFKRWLTRYIPEEAERSTYVLLSTVCLALLFWLWAPLGGVVWNVSNQWGQYALFGLYFGSWALFLFATFLINHFDLFGLRQAYYALLGREIPAPKFVTPALYRIIRHSIRLGWLGIFWFTPTMSETHLMFAVISTLYIFVGIRFEERDLEEAHPEYTRYNPKTKRNGSALVSSLSQRLRAKSQTGTV